MTINEAHKQMTEGKKVTHPKLGFEVQHLTIMLGLSVIDKYGNNKDEFFEGLRLNSAFAAGWVRTQINS